MAFIVKAGQEWEVSAAKEIYDTFKGFVFTNLFVQGPSFARLVNCFTFLCLGKIHCKMFHIRAKDAF